MKLLFDDRFAPITSSIGFLATDLESAAKEYTRWISDIEHQNGRKLRSERVSGSLESILPNLLPLTSGVKTRSLLVPTTAHWTAYFDNFVLGTDASPVMSHMARLVNCRSVAFVAISSEKELQRGVDGRDPATVFELFEPLDTDWLNVARSISLTNDDGWVFELGGRQQDFEEPTFYQNRNIRQRFPLELLDRYLRALGIRAFDPDFYMPTDSFAYLTEKVGNFPKGIERFGLEDALSR